MNSLHRRARNVILYSLSRTRSCCVSVSFVGNQTPSFHVSNFIFTHLRMSPQVLSLVRVQSRNTRWSLVAIRKFSWNSGSCLRKINGFRECGGPAMLAVAACWVRMSRAWWSFSNKYWIFQVAVISLTSQGACLLHQNRNETKLLGIATCHS